MKKTYVKAVITVDEDGNKKPQSIVFREKTYNIDRVLDVKNSASMRVGGIGERYTIRINGYETYLFCERGKWFVEEK